MDSRLYRPKDSRQDIRRGGFRLGAQTRDMGGHSLAVSEPAGAAAVIAAIYARKSNEQNAPEEERSVTAQVERARAYAQRQGWTIAEGHIYTDDGVSGAEFESRPGLVALLAALKPWAP